MLSLDALRLYGPNDNRTKAIVKLLKDTIFVREQIIAVLQDSKLSPGDFVLQPAALAWREIVPIAAMNNKLDGLVEVVTRRDPEFGVRLEQVLRPLLAPADLWYPCRDPYYCGFFGPGATTAMIDRDGLRTGLQNLVNDQYRVFIVSGARKSGKTHSWLLIDHIRQAGKLAGHECVCVSTHDWSTGTKVSGAMMVQAIADQLSLNVRATGSDELGEARTRKLLNLLAGEYPKGDGVTRWIVLDGLDRDEAMNAVDAKDVALKLIPMVNTSRLPDTRLVITGFDPLWLQSRRQILFETIPAIDEIRVSSFLADTAGHLGYQVDPASLARFATEVIGAGGPSRDLELIEDAVVRLVKREWGPGGQHAD
jgi:hypothetical protein